MNLALLVLQTGIDLKNLEVVVKQIRGDAAFGSARSCSTGRFGPPGSAQSHSESPPSKAREH